MIVQELEYFVFFGHGSFDLRLKYKKIRLIFQIFEPKKCNIGEVLSRKRYNNALLTFHILLDMYYAIVYICANLIFEGYE